VNQANISLVVLDKVDEDLAAHDEGLAAAATHDEELAAVTALAATKNTRAVSKKIAVKVFKDKFDKV
jgi:Na+-transporting methylmalonyl-CoA/oxaloacetate decarboxylase gamma subunit